jgi:hypothetical protein
MLVYRATEKDCMGEDGLANECVICLEDFEVGDEMGRLECLCKFHRVRLSCHRLADTKLTSSLEMHTRLVGEERLRHMSDPSTS